MICLTRLNNCPLVINSDLIQQVESAPDTVLTLVTGEKMVVLESSDEVIEKVIDFRRKILANPPLRAVHPNSPLGEVTPPTQRASEEG